MKHALTVESNGKAATEEKSFRLKTILVPIDFSERGRFAFRYATHLAEKVGAKVIVLNVVGSPLMYAAFTPADEQEYAHEAQHKLDQLCRTDARGSEEVQTMVRLAAESVPEEIALAAREVAADLIVLPADQRRFRHVLLANTVDKIERHAPCPVLMVPVPPSVGGTVEEYPT